MARVFVLCLFIFWASCVIAEESFERVKRAPGRNCPRISNFNGKVKYRRKGTRAVFRCGKSFTRYGNKAVNCRSDNTWTGEPPVCIKANCVPKDIRHLEKLDMTEMYQGALLTFSCEDNYKLIGITEIYCNGKVWNADPPVCKAPKQLLECDFEDDLCGWSQDESDDLDWIRNQGQTSTGGTGPRIDHTLQTSAGHYMFVESSNPATTGDEARLMSPLYPTDMGNMCFEFWYHILGPDDTGHVGTLEVYIIGESEFLDDLQPVFVKDGNQGDEWKRAEIYVDKRDEPYQIVIATVRKLSYISDIAIDDVKLYNCSGTTPAVSSTSKPTIANSSTTHIQLSTNSPTMSSKSSTFTPYSSLSSKRASEPTSSIDVHSTSSLPNITSVTEISPMSHQSSIKVSSTTAEASKLSLATTSSHKTHKATSQSGLTTTSTSKTTTTSVPTTSDSSPKSSETQSTVPAATPTPTTLSASTTIRPSAPTTTVTSASSAKTSAKSTTAKTAMTTAKPLSTTSLGKDTISVKETSTEATKSTTKAPTTVESTTKSSTIPTTSLTQTTEKSATTQPSTSKTTSTLLTTTTPASTTITIPSTSTVILTTKKRPTTTPIPLTTSTSVPTTIRQRTTITSTVISTSKTSTVKSSSAYPVTPSNTKTSTTIKSTTRTKPTKVTTKANPTKPTRRLKPTKPTTRAKSTKRPTTKAKNTKSPSKMTTKGLISTSPVSMDKTETTGSGVNSQTTKNNNTDIKISIAEQRAQHPDDDTLKPLMIGLGVGIFCGLIIIGVVAWVCVRRKKFYTRGYEDELKPITKSSSNDNFTGIQYEYHDDEYEQ